MTAHRANFLTDYLKSHHMSSTTFAKNVRILAGRSVGRWCPSMPGSVSRALILHVDMVGVSIDNAVIGWIVKAIVKFIFLAPEIFPGGVDVVFLSFTYIDF